MRRGIVTFLKAIGLNFFRPQHPEQAWANRSFAATGRVGTLSAQKATQQRMEMVYPLLAGRGKTARLVKSGANPFLQALDHIFNFEFYPIQSRPGAPVEFGRVVHKGSE